MRTSTSSLCFPPFSSRCVRYFWLRVWKAGLRTILTSSTYRYSSVTSTIWRKKVIIMWLVFVATWLVAVLRLSAYKKSFISFSILEFRIFVSLAMSCPFVVESTRRVPFRFYSSEKRSTLSESSMSSAILVRTERQLQRRVMCLAFIPLLLSLPKVSALASWINSLLFRQKDSIKSYNLS